MPRVDFLTGTKAAEPDLQTVADQSLMVCTSSTRPASPAAGWHIYETDTKKILVHDGTAWRENIFGSAAWTSWTPTVTQGTTITLGSNSCKYMTSGKVTLARGTILLNSTGTSGSELLVSLPNTGVSIGISVSTFGTSIGPIGTATFSHGGTVYRCAAEMSTTTSMHFVTTSMFIGSSFAAGAGDAIFFNIAYENT